ncbi:hypothetical protein CAPTEDRAFT_216475 [Capitella teleta]|uniref:G-protein coupled receptors family 1 profile domain-containing protein n=1 Tax=Capitella teleta TaxID=283909 RepID=R7TDW3_CAPTE|nr:hypothetical protein CAPTEDRAFT_216475 [Capitella teleta]|eukprot:ELT91943.1 hypothetical protein CAPTEDRAFT_216475 [Capitella teleta]
METSTEVSSLEAANGPPPSAPFYFRFFGVVLLIESLLVIVLNPITVLAVIKSKLAQKSSAHFLIAVLSVSDFLCGLQFFCHQLLRMLIPIVGVNKAVIEANWCLYMTSAIVVPSSSFVSLLIGIDRFIAVSYPTEYMQKMKIRNAAVMVAVMWVFSIGRILPAGVYKRLQDDQLAFIAHNRDAFPRGYSLYFSAPLGLIALLLNTLLYARIFQLFKAQSNRIAGSVNHDLSTKRSQRLTRLSLIVVCVFIACLTPVILMSLLPQPEGGPLALNAYNVVSSFSAVLIIAPSFVNNIIFAWQHQDYRKAYLNLIGRKPADNTEVSQQTSENPK